MAKPPPSLETRFTRWPWWRRWFGQRSECAAARYLRKLGYRMIATNWKDRRGELDILALDAQTFVVVEVRSTQGDDLRTIAASVDRVKQKKIIQAAIRYLHKNKLNKIPIRFDVLVLSWKPGMNQPLVVHYKNAFESPFGDQMNY